MSRWPADHVTVKQAAEALGVSYTTITRRQYLGDLPYPFTHETLTLWVERVKAAGSFVNVFKELKPKPMKEVKARPISGRTVARELSVSHQTVYNWIASGLLELPITREQIELLQELRQLGIPRPSFQRLDYILTERKGRKRLAHPYLRIVERSAVNSPRRRMAPTLIERKSRARLTWKKQAGMYVHAVERAMARCAARQRQEAKRAEDEALRRLRRSSYDQLLGERRARLREEAMERDLQKAARRAAREHKKASRTSKVNQRTAERLAAREAVLREMQAKHEKEPGERKPLDPAYMTLAEVEDETGYGPQALIPYQKAGVVTFLRKKGITCIARAQLASALASGSLPRLIRRHSS